MSFLKEYIKFIAFLGAKIKPVEWWYTSLSSKNRFQSPLMSAFEVYYFGQSSLGPPARLTFKAFAKSFLADCFKSIYAWIVGWRARGLIRKDTTKYDVLMTFSYAASFTSTDFKDSYWGPLPDFLKKDRPILQIHLPIGCYFKSLEFFNKNPNVVPIYSLVSPLIFLKAAYRLLRLSVSWNLDAIDDNEKLKPIVRTYLSQEILNPSLFYAILVELVFNDLAKNKKVSQVLIPFEGNAWERGVVKGIKTIDKTILVRGYVHTVIPEISTNLFPGPSEFQDGPFPDKILTLGDIPTKVLAEKGSFPMGILETSCALRFSSLFKLEKAPEVVDKKILVLLEGVFPAVQVVDYFLKQAKNNPSWIFQFRFHPALTWEKLKKLSTFSDNISENVIFSKNKSLYQEINEAKIVAYWGSTAGIEALYMGRPVIHLDLGSVLSYDPLFMHKGYHWKVSKSSELSVVLREIDSLSEVQKTELCKESEIFLKNYFSEITEEKMKRFL